MAAKEMENLKALVYGKELTAYQRKLAQNEFEKLIQEWVFRQEYAKQKCEEVYFEIKHNADSIFKNSDNSQLALLEIAKMIDNTKLPKFE
jgi:hypothetical protein